MSKIIFFLLMLCPMFCVSQQTGQIIKNYSYYDLNFSSQAAKSKVTIDFDKKSITVNAPFDVLSYTYSRHEYKEGKLYTIYTFYVNNDKSINYFTYNVSLNECTIEFVTGDWIKMYNK